MAWRLYIYILFSSEFSWLLKYIYTRDTGETLVKERERARQRERERKKKALGAFPANDFAYPARSSAIYAFLSLSRALLHRPASHPLTASRNFQDLLCRRAHLSLSLGPQSKRGPRGFFFFFWGDKTAALARPPQPVVVPAENGGEQLILRVICTPRAIS